MAKILNKQLAPERCTRCSRYKNFPKYSCKECLHSHTSNFSLDKSYDYNYLNKVRKREKRNSSDPRVVALYTNIKEKYFNGNYVPEAQFVTFQWKRGLSSGGGWCQKTTKTIRLGKRYQKAFDTSGDGISYRRRFVELMIHEMLHLRLPHHRKHFKTREAELLALVKDEHMDELYGEANNKEGVVQTDRRMS